MAPWIEALARVRLGLSDPAIVEDELPDVSDLDRVTRAYRAELTKQNVVDFDEQVTAAIGRLLSDPIFRQRTQRFARVLLVDEFQDLTPAHLLLIRLVAGPAGAVYGVGDDDQTIYGYAGATPRWLVDFTHWFPGAATHSLEVNYRCPPPVVIAASNLLTRNALRVPKNIRPAPIDRRPTDRQALATLAGGVRPATRAVERVREILDSGANPADVAVLARVKPVVSPGTGPAPHQWDRRRRRGKPAVSPTGWRPGGSVVVGRGYRPPALLPRIVPARGGTAPQAWHEHFLARPGEQERLTRSLGEPVRVARRQRERARSRQGTSTGR